MQRKFGSMARPTACSAPGIEMATRSDSPPTPGSSRKGCSAPPLRPLPRNSGRAGVVRICGGSRCRPWSATWRESCGPLRHWRGSSTPPVGRVDNSPVWSEAKRWDAFPSYTLVRSRRCEMFCCRPSLLTPMFSNSDSGLADALYRAGKIWAGKIALAPSRKSLPCPHPLLNHPRFCPKQNPRP